ncbi:MAG: hypothetical protein KAR00_00185 [Candidatus Pacebacteria bacterium]|nr:hypothetical protein [Candidatus Paceibacterota bacterium]
MELPNNAVTLDKFEKLIEKFITTDSKKEGGRLVHKKCGGTIRIGFVPLFYLGEDGSLDPGPDGFGIGKKRVPYCEKCDPPDGFNFSYARRIPILKQ